MRKNQTTVDSPCSPDYFAFANLWSNTEKPDGTPTPDADRLRQEYLKDWIARSVAASGGALGFYRGRPPLTTEGERIYRILRPILSQATEEHWQARTVIAALRVESLAECGLALI